MFKAGRELCGEFYAQAVRPILDAEFSGISHSAGLIGPGSEVLGFDTERSSDHHWGPRVQLFVERHDPRIADVLARQLPHHFQGWSTSFALPDPDDNGVRLLEERPEGPVNHRVEVTEPGPFFADLLGFAPRDPVSLQDWLGTPSQLLRSVTSAAVYHDELGVLEGAKRALEWYPHDVWLYLLACQWRRIAQEEHLMGRAGEVEDDLGSRLLTGRLVRDVMRLCFLQERQYAPYAKWFGTAFRQLEASEELLGVLEASMDASTWGEREAALSEAYEALARRHNALGITATVDPTVRLFHSRPFHVIGGDRFVKACRAAIQDPRVRELSLLGSIDQFGDSTDLLSSVGQARQVAQALDL